jgi:hypothetical protein
MKHLKLIFITYTGKLTEIKNLNELFKPVLISLFTILLIYMSLSLAIANRTYSAISNLEEKMKGLYESKAISYFFYSMNTFPGTILWGGLFIILFLIYQIFFGFLIYKFLGTETKSLKSFSIAHISGYGLFLLFLFPLLLYRELLSNDSILSSTFYTSICLITFFTGLFYYLKRYIQISNYYLKEKKRLAFVNWITPISVLFFYLYSIY